VKDMDNKPIAWMQMTDKQCITKISFVQTWADDVPLYTHPAKTEDEGKVCARCGAIAYDPVITQTAKTLTDEEIRHLQAQCHLKNVGYDTFIMRFARAILRKAQEK
jgi:hypothetical protein